MVENKRKTVLEQTFVNVYFAVFCMFFVIPLLMVIIASISDEKEILKYGYQMIPKKLSSLSYATVFKVPQKIINAYQITVFNSVVGSAMSTVTMGLAAYPLSRRDFAYRRIITFIFWVTTLFSGGLIPSYIINTQYLHLNDTI